MLKSDNRGTELSEARIAFNRLFGLSSYAGGTIVLGLMAFCIFDDGGIKGDATSYVIGFVAALALLGIGYSTGRLRHRDKPPNTVGERPHALERPNGPDSQ
jgi:hypothetical protein